MDAVVEMKSSTHVGPFQMEILEGKLSQVPTHDAHVMVTPLGHAQSQSGTGDTSCPQDYKCCMCTPHSLLVVSK